MLELFKNNNLLPFFFTFFPALIYSIIVWLNSPPFAIRWRVAFLYFLMGIMSTLLVTSYQWVFPQWRTALAPDDFYLSMFIFCFLQIAALEEGSKFLMFKITDAVRQTKWVDHPSAIMFYGMSVSAGFAVNENLIYTQIYGHEVLLARAFSSVVVHMVCGLIMGYFMALGRLNPGDNVTRTWNPTFRAISFTAIGVVSAMLFHGGYDFVLFATQGNPGVWGMTAMIFTGLFLTIFMADRIQKKLKV